MSDSAEDVVERIAGNIDSVEFVDDETRGEDDDRPTGTYVTIMIPERHSWWATSVVIERPGHAHKNGGQS